MRRPPSPSTCVLGFFTVVEYPDQGLFGGYLLLNRMGKPLEFHCTTPVRPNRAQQILYGPSLYPFLYGEQIGATLVKHAKVSPIAVLTDSEPGLAVREHIEIPVAMVLSAANEVPAAGAAVADRAIRFDGAHAAGSPTGPHRTVGGEVVLFELGTQQLGLPRERESDRLVITERMAALPEAFDLNEPFGRIREAIAEARKGAR